MVLHLENYLVLDVIGLVAHGVHVLHVGYTPVNPQQYLAHHVDQLLPKTDWLIRRWCSGDIVRQNSFILNKNSSNSCLISNFNFHLVLTSGDLRSRSWLMKQKTCALFPSWMLTCPPPPDLLNSCTTISQKDLRWVINCLAQILPSTL